MVGLDLGTTEFRSLTQLGQGLSRRRLPAVYAAVEDDAAHRRLLECARLPFSTCPGYLLTVGAPAVELSQLIPVELRALLPGGQVPQNDPLTRQLLASAVESCLPETYGRDPLCVWSLGATGPESIPTRDFLRQVLTLRGYQSQEISAGESLVLSELSPQGYSGLAVVFGANRCSASLCLQGRELWQKSLAWGGNWLDEQYARYTSSTTWKPNGDQLLDLQQCRAWRESLPESALSSAAPEHHLLYDLLRDLLSQTLGELSVDMLEHAACVPPLTRVTLLAGGGLTGIPGFRELLTAAMSATAWPLEVLELVLVPDSGGSIARGALIRATLESANGLRAA